jgi:16S rRNA processing protein RimM
MQSKTEWATIGRIVAFFGLRGELKVVSLSDVPNRFAELKVVYLGSEHVSYTIDAVRPYKGEMIILKLAGVDDVNTAETLRNQAICIPLSALAKLPPDSYYQHDILGLQVATLAGWEVGTIIEIMPTGGNDVYIVKMPDGREVLIPAIKEVIKQVDLIRHVMYIDPIKGLLDEEEAAIDEQEDSLTGEEQTSN